MNQSKLKALNKVSEKYLEENFRWTISFKFTIIPFYVGEIIVVDT